MIRTNLSTRPFYNEAAVRFWLGVIGGLMVAATIFNVQRLIHYSRSDTEQATQAGRDEQRAKDLRADATRLRASVDTAQIEAAAIEAKAANELIDRRTFSWTEVFNRFEATLPADVRITSLRHTLDQSRGILLTISILARDVENVNQFIENLEATKAFSEVLAAQEQVNPENGQLEVILQAVYHPSIDQRPLAGDQRPLAGDQRPPAGDQRPPAGDQRPLAGERSPAAAQSPPVVETAATVMAPVKDVGR